MNSLEKNVKSYIFVRTDLTPQQITVQSSHAILYMAQHCIIKPEDHPSVIVIGIKNKEKLLNALESLMLAGIELYPFYEPMFNNEITAFATIPLSEDQQQKLKKFQLIKSSHFCGIEKSEIKIKENL